MIFDKWASIVDEDGQKSDRRGRVGHRSGGGTIDHRKWPNMGRAARLAENGAMGRYAPAVGAMSGVTLFVHAGTTLFVAVEATSFYIDVELRHLTR
jgi:hypothetical protein